MSSTAAAPRFVTVRRWWAWLGDLVRPASDAVRAGTECVSTLGWTVAVFGVVALVAGWVLGWQEFRIVGAALLLLLLLSLLFLIGRTQLEVDLELEPARLVAGESAAGHVAVTNVARTPLLPLGLEVPVGDVAARFTLPALAPQGGFEEVLVIPTQARGVIPVGPVRTQRGDPFGLVRRELEWSEGLELFVHPRTIALETLGAGLLRDLEGVTSNDVSMSDLAFHTLREYEPGDDRRYIHWRSSAKVSGSSGQGTFLVRQFLDTRRSHVAVIVDVDEASYTHPDEFELALSCGASVTLRALADEMETTVVCGEQAAVQPAAHTALDTYSRAAFGPWPLPAATSRLGTLAPDVSAVVLVTGPLTTFEVLQRARAYLAPQVRLVAVQVVPGSALSYKEGAGIVVVTLGELAELPLVLAGGVTA
ncbi:DUF58 domain-containing protein [Propioniciclava sinopodophylli]|uniref:DUF58 domain-containing protein n=1 Tax=Propioniciclava sinopodophylli TaxID=1837344 RepID=A0A4Q9KD43_9ACTN|nr:DUF58 domain-containing protein [Propioniciclava sinopodophylli]TBT83754.1 DUF58 domain-containing protein [Propioniciclava sinopodophylli]